MTALERFEDFKKSIPNRLTVPGPAYGGPYGVMILETDLQFLLKAFQVMREIAVHNRDRDYEDVDQEFEERMKKG